MRTKDCVNFMFSALILGLLVLTTTANSQELRREGRYFVAELEHSFKVEKNGTVRIFEVRGDVRVQAWAKMEVLIKEVKRMDVYTRKEAETVLNKSKSSVKKDGNIIEIGGEYYSRDWINSSFTIMTPASFNVEVDTRGGDIEVSDIEGELDLKTSGGDVEIDNAGGKVKARTSGGDVKVFGSKKDTFLKTSGGDIELRDIGGDLQAKTSGGDITLKKSNGNVELHTSGGDIEISKVDGYVKAHTSGGDIEVSDAKGDVEVHTSGGDLELKNITGTLNASTSGGDIFGWKIYKSVEVSTSGGDIELKDIKGGVQGKTAGGDIEVEITLTDFSVEHAIDLRTAGGEITLTIPEKLPARISAKIEITDRWEDYNIYSDFPLTSSDENKKRSGFGRRKRFVKSEGSINGGGDLIELFAANGNIHIKKLR